MFLMWWTAPAADQRVAGDFPAFAPEIDVP
jgi:hypothetical protein